MTTTHVRVDRRRRRRLIAQIRLSSGERSHGCARKWGMATVPGDGSRTPTTRTRTSPGKGLGRNTAPRQAPERPPGRGHEKPGRPPPMAGRRRPHLACGRHPLTPWRASRRRVARTPQHQQGRRRSSLALRSRPRPQRKAPLTWVVPSLERPFRGRSPPQERPEKASRESGPARKSSRIWSRRYDHNLAKRQFVGLTLRCVQRPEAHSRGTSPKT